MVEPQYSLLSSYNPIIYLFSTAQNLINALLFLATKGG